MNICLVSREYPPETGWGGIGTYVYNLAHELTELGHNVHVIAYAPDKEMEYRDVNVFVHRIKEKKIKCLWRLERYIPVSMLLYSIRVAEILKEVINKHKIDIVEFPNWYAEGFWFLLKRKQIPVVTRIHTPYFEILKISVQSPTLRDKIRCWIEKKATIRSDALVCSTVCHSKMVSAEYRILANRIEIIPLGIKLLKSEKNAMFYPESVNNGCFNILYVSRLEKRKGTEVLLSVIPEIISKFPHLHLSLIGNDGKDRYKRWFKEKYSDLYCSNVHFLGYLERGELEERYQLCDLFVLPSLYESFGLVYLEAMKYAKPVIGCKSGGISEIIDDGETGLLVSPNDPYSLSNAIIHMVENKSVREKLGVAALKKVKANFTAKIMAERTLKSYSEILVRYNSVRQHKN